MRRQRRWDASPGASGSRGRWPCPIEGRTSQRRPEHAPSAPKPKEPAVVVAGALPATPSPYVEEGRRGDAGASARSGRAAEDGLVKEKALKVGGWPRTGHFHKPLKGLRHDKPAQERLCGQMGPSRGPQLATGERVRRSLLGVCHGRTAAAHGPSRTRCCSDDARRKPS